MEKTNFGYSLKNIPIPKKEHYMKSLIDKTYKFLRRMRWKAYFFENPSGEKKRENFGFNSEKSPPPVKDLLAFEADMYKLIKNIQYKQHYSNSLQQKMNKDIKDMRSSGCFYVEADKTTNIYKLSPGQYNKLLNDNITTTYTKQSILAKSTIDAEAKTIAEKHLIADRAEVFAVRDTYITLKDHKDNFVNNPKCRLINPAKGEMGIVSKKLLEAINMQVHRGINANQWRNTGTVIEWFNSIKSKDSCKFVQLDIVEFYPSISQKLLTDALNFAKIHTDIDENTHDVIMHSRKSLLFRKEEVWVKKDNSSFDVTMGSYDGAEVCELVGLFILDRIKRECPGLELGLYRDDGLGTTRNLSGPQTERLRKKLFSIFKSCGLKITVDCNLTQVDFLDVTFNLDTGKFWPYRKPNNNPLYIHQKSNHPPSIIKQLPTMIASRVSATSCDEIEFNKVKPEYDSALRVSGFKQGIKFTKDPQQRSRHRQRKVIWFNPPYNASVLTNIGKAFLAMLSKHFPRDHKYYKIFNKQTVKLSYSCCPNVKSIISQHNRKLLHCKEDVVAPVEPKCNCRKPELCPLSGHCLQSSVIYKATVSSENEEKFYIGATEQTFKKRFPKHKDALEKKNAKSATSLSTYVWRLKDKGETPTIKWEILKKCRPYTCGSRRCDVCLSEKLCILKADAQCINMNTELMQKCRHSNKFKLKAVHEKGKCTKGSNP